MEPAPLVPNRPRTDAPDTRRRTYLEILTMKLTAFALSLALSLPLAACGGGGGGNDDNNQPVQETIVSTGTLDGIIAFDNQGDVPVGGANGIPIVGDGPFVQGGQGSLNRNGLWSFDLSSIPNNATITSATLRLFVSGSANDPQGAMGLMRVDHVNFGATFPASIGQINTLTFDFAQINDFTTIGERLVDAATQVQNDVDNGRGRSQFRVRGAIGSNNDNVTDQTIFTDADNTANAANRPMLIIEYTTP